MIVELIKKCINKCNILLFSTTGAVHLLNNRCDSCVFNFEKTVCFGEKNEKELSFDEFKKIIDFLDEINFISIVVGDKFGFQIIQRNNNKIEKCKLLNLFIENNVYKKHCLKVLDREMKNIFERKIK